MTLDNALVLPEQAVDIIVDDVTGYGRTGVETGGFILEADDYTQTSIVALAGTAGIVRGPLFLQISECALDRLFTFADDQRLAIPLQFHSHKAGAFLSPTDKRHGFRVEGFISTVVPTFAEPPRDLERWAWFRFEAGDWQSIAPAGHTTGSVETVVFDEDGVRDR